MTSGPPSAMAAAAGFMAKKSRALCFAPLGTQVGSSVPSPRRGVKPPCCNFSIASSGAMFQSPPRTQGSPDSAAAAAHVSQMVSFVSDQPSESRR